MEKKVSVRNRTQKVLRLFTESKFQELVALRDSLPQFPQKTSEKLMKKNKSKQKSKTAVHCAKALAKEILFLFAIGDFQTMEALRQEVTEGKNSAIGNLKSTVKEALKSKTETPSEFNLRSGLDQNNGKSGFEEKELAAKRDRIPQSQETPQDW